MTPQEAIAAAELAEAETAYRNQLAREMYALGRRDAEAEMAEAWRQAAAPVAHGPLGPELEGRRWGPGGRAHFGDPRPGDFPGRTAEPEPEADREPELEANHMSEPVTVHVARFNDPMPDPALLAEREAGDKGPRIFAWPEPEPELEAEIGG